MSSALNNPFGKKVALINILALILFSLDRLTKLFFQSSARQDFFVWPGWLEFKFSRNLNLALGFALPSIWQNCLILAAVLAVAWFLLEAYKTKKVFLIYCLSLILVGAMSNLLDRIRFGYVVDFIDVPFFSVFNLADVYITMGVILILFSQLWPNSSNKTSLRT